MQITPAESLVMDVLWHADRPLAAEEVREALTHGEWSEATVRTFLTRLTKKKALAASRDGKRFLYRPIATRADYLHAESKKVVDRLFGGQIAPFLAHFSARQNLSPEELTDLRRLIERLDNNE